MTLDCRGINIKDPGRFRTEADNLEEQLCCFNIENNDRCLNAFLGKTIRNRELSTDAIHFQTKRVKIRTKNNGGTFDATEELENLISNSASISGHGREKQVGGKAKSSTSSRGRKRSQQDLDFFLCDEEEPKRKKARKIK